MLSLTSMIPVILLLVVSVALCVGMALTGMATRRRCEQILRKRIKESEGKLRRDMAAYHEMISAVVTDATGQIEVLEDAISEQHARLEELRGHLDKFKKVQTFNHRNQLRLLDEKVIRIETDFAAIADGVATVNTALKVLQRSRPKDTKPIAAPSVQSARPGPPQARPAFADSLP